jgi:protein-tyrosine phosphatase
MDRTGLVAGAYYMARWKNATAEEIHQANHDVAKRKLNLPGQNALQWAGGLEVTKA